MKSAIIGIIILILGFLGFSEYQQKQAEPVVEAVVDSILQPESEADSGFVVKVYDGDTFNLKDGRRVRLIGLDAPEIGEENDIASRDYLASLILEKEVILKTDKESADKYERLLAYVYIEEKFVNELLIENGWAESKSYYPNTTKQEILDQAEEKAKENKRGIWK